MTIVKVSDPAVIFLSGGYFYHFKDQAGRFGEVDPPDSIDWGVGMSYALNPFVSISTRFNSRYTEKTIINGFEIHGSDQTSATLGLGVTYGLSGSSALDVSANFGLTEDAPDFAIRMSIPYTLDLPRFWGNWRLRNLLRF